MKFKITIYFILVAFLMVGCGAITPSASTAYPTVTLVRSATVNNMPTATLSNTLEPAVTVSSPSMTPGLTSAPASTASFTPKPGLLLSQLIAFEGLEVANIRAISIQDNWVGLSDIAPILSYYSLLPNGEEFTGLVNFDVGGYSRKNRISELQDLHVPAKAIQLFLNKLQTTSIREGDYQPTIEHTDDYPTLEIRIVLTNFDLTFYTSSQGERHTPWGMTCFGHTYVIDSATPMDALDILLPYLKKDRLKVLEDQVVKSMNEPTPTPTP